MRRLSHLFLACTTILLITSCDKWWNTTKEISNNTNDTITLYLYDQSAIMSNIDSLVILPNSNKIFVKDERSMSNECNPYINKGEYLVKTSSQRILKKDISNPSNWNCDEKKSSVTLSFEINESNLE